jgi:hypothetical protein
MKNFVVLAVFLSSMFFGLMLAGSSDPTNEFENNSLQTDEILDKSLFTLCEANRLSGKKVISKNRDFRKNRIGRIVSFEMIAPDKFLIEIYWGNGATDENSTVTFHDKESLLRDFKILD